MTAKYACMACRTNASQLTMARRDLAHAARKAVRDPTTRNVEETKRARTEVEKRKAASQAHKKECEVLAA